MFLVSLDKDSGHAIIELNPVDLRALALACADRFPESAGPDHDKYALLLKSMSVAFHLAAELGDPEETYT